MAVAGTTPPPIFKRGPSPLVRLLLFSAAALALMVADMRYRFVDPLRLALGTAVLPVQHAISSPVVLAQDTSSYLNSVTYLQQQNQELQRRQIELSQKMLTAEHVEAENQRLRALLDLKENHIGRAIAAEILYTARDPFSRRVILDKGSLQNIVAGQAVLDEYGVIGQVTRVFPTQSEVTLLTNKELGIPVQVVRNGLRASLFGNGSGQLELRYLAANADVQVGDTLVTSGLDGLYVPGLPVARVARVDRDVGFLCTPMGGVENGSVVLVLAPREIAPRPPEVTETAERPLRGKRARRAAAQP